MSARTCPVGSVLAAAMAIIPQVMASQLIVTSEPPAAEVRINGEARGVTPLNTEIAATAVGQCEVIVSLEGYQSVRMAYTVVPGQFETLHFYLYPVGAVAPAADTDPGPGPVVPDGTTGITVTADDGPAPPAGHRELREWLAGLLTALHMLR